MRCHTALDRMASLDASERLIRDSDLTGHLKGCPACTEAWRLHRAVISLLSAPAPLPAFADLRPAILDRIDRLSAQRHSWHRIAVAALAVAALALGYFFGQMDEVASPVVDSMAATYQAALTAQATGTAELAYLETDLRAPRSIHPEATP